jgi:hypothetical protein
VRDQWILAYADYQGQKHPFWFNPAKLDKAGYPLRTWALPELPLLTLAPHTLPASPSCTHFEGAAQQASETPSYKLNFFDGGGLLHAAYKVLGEIFDQGYPHLGAAPSLPVTLRFLCYLPFGAFSSKS